MILIIYIDLLEEIFKKYNYHQPQPFITIFGKKIIEWIIDYIDINRMNKIIIIYNDKYYINDVKNIFKNRNNIYISTQFNILNEVENEKNNPVLYIDTKIFYLLNFLDIWEKNNFCNIVFKNDLYNTSLYGFNNLSLLKKYINKKFSNQLFTNQLFTNQLTINELFNDMINDNIEFKLIELKDDEYIYLNTPLNIRLFCNNFPKIESIFNRELIKKKRILFNLDNVNDINDIQYINYLKKIGNIIILTTELDNTHKDNVIMNINSQNIKYDELYFNYPNISFIFSKFS